MGACGVEFATKATKEAFEYIRRTCPATGWVLVLENQVVGLDLPSEDADDERMEVREAGSNNG